MMRGALREFLSWCVAGVVVGLMVIVVLLFLAMKP